MSALSRTVAPAIALAVAVAFASGAEERERIVVTASRIPALDEYAMPHVGLTRRADFLLRTVNVVNDTPNSERRTDELHAMLRDMLRAADGDDEIVLSALVAVDDPNSYDDAPPIVAPFTEEMIASAVQPRFSNREGTSFVELVVKTPISQTDTLVRANARIDAFLRSIDVIGRSEFLTDEDEALSVVDPASYRGEIIAAMSADAAGIVERLGPTYGARFEGLENEVAWYRSGVLELRLFIPHRLSFAPAGQ